MQTTSEGIPYPEASDPFPITPLFKKMADGMNTAVAKANTNASNALTAANTATTDAAAAKTAATNAQNSATNAANSASAAQTAAGSLTAGTVTTVATGQPATAAVRVVGSTRYIDLGLPQGATGATGQAGPAGVTSAVANNLASGAAATASVANGVLTLGIPAGQAGPAGSAGPTGPAGAPELVRNGDGGLGTNANWSPMVYTASDAPNGVPASFYAAINSAASYLCSDAIPISAAKRYLFRCQARQTVAGLTTQPRFYMAVAGIDRSGATIGPTHYLWVSGTMTVLAADLKPGDTTVYLNNTANWYGSAAKPATHPSLRTFQIWNWTDSGGKTWRPGTYTRNLSPVDAWADGGVNTTNNTITLRTAWAGATIPAGTYVSNAAMSGTYLYPPNVTNVAVPEAWTRYAEMVPPIMAENSTANAVAGYLASDITWGIGLCQATVSVRIGFLVNQTYSTGKHAVADISLSEAGAALFTAQDAMVQAEDIRGMVESKADQYHSHMSSDINDLSAVLSTRAPAEHTHTIAQVTDLQAALDGKAATTHTHSPVSVGVQSGKFAIPSLAAGAAGNVSVTFPTAYDTAPNVVACPNSSVISVAVQNVTTTGFSAVFVNRGTTASSAGDGFWISSK